MAVSGWIVDPTAADYSNVAAISGAFAQAFDLVWNDATALNWLQIQSIQSVCQEQFAGHAPGSLDNVVFTQPSNWAVPAAACAALVLEGDAFVTSEGITPNTPGTGGGGGAPIQNVRFYDDAFVGTSTGSISAPFTTFNAFYTEVLTSSEGWELTLPGRQVTPEVNMPDFVNSPGVSLKGVDRGFTILSTLVIDVQTGFLTLTISDVEIQQLTIGDANVSFQFFNSFIDASTLGAVTGHIRLSDCEIGPIDFGAANNGLLVDMYDGHISALCEFFQASFWDVTIGAGTSIVPGNGTTRFIGCIFAAGVTISNANTPTIELDPVSYYWYITNGVVFAGTVVLTPSTGNTNPAVDLTVYVRKGGSDSTGDGSFNKPFATINAGCTLIRSFANASTTNRYTILVGTGRYTEALTMSEWTFVVGDSCEGTRVTFSSFTLGADFTPNVDHRCGFQSMTISGGQTVDFNAVSSNQGKIRFDNVTFNDRWTFTAFSAINQVLLNDCFMFNGYVQNGINLVAYGACSIQGNVAMNSINDGRNLPTLAAFVGCGMDSLTETWTASAGANPVTSVFQGAGMTGLLTLDGAQASVDATSNPIAFPGGVTLLNSATDPRKSLTGSRVANPALATVCTQLQASGSFVDNTTI